jgi:hypothetical protein
MSYIEDNYLHLKIVKYLENEASLSWISTMWNFARGEEFFFGFSINSTRKITRQRKFTPIVENWLKIVWESVLIGQF